MTPDQTGMICDIYCSDSLHYIKRHVLTYKERLAMNGMGYITEEVDSWDAPVGLFPKVTLAGWPWSWVITSRTGNSLRSPQTDDQ